MGPAEPDGSATQEGDAPPEAEKRRPLREIPPETTCDTRGRLNPNKNLCKVCGTLIKLMDGRRTCVHNTRAENLGYKADTKAGVLDLVTNDGQLYGSIAYIRGLRDHPLREAVPFVRRLERALDDTDTM